MTDEEYMDYKDWKLKSRPLDLFIFIGIFLFAVIIIASIAGTKAEATSQNEPYPMTDVQAVECGTCGAHIIEWWYVRNDTDTNFVAVCSKCYDKITK